MQKILVLDFGGQYNQLIARRVREQHIYAEIKSYRSITAEEIQAAGYAGVIFTGGPNSVYDPLSPHCDPAILDAGIPILGICYGCQLIAYLAGGSVAFAENSSEYGRISLTVRDDPLFCGVPRESECWMSHRDYVTEVPDGFAVTAYTASCPTAAMCDGTRRIYGVQFHPEVTHTAFGERILHNFLYDICGCVGDWRMDSFIEDSVAAYRTRLSGKKALCALSGGVDSAVAAVLLHRAIGDDLICVFVDHGLLRKDEARSVVQLFHDTFRMNLICVDAADSFLHRLSGISEPEQKRRIIGEEFIRVFENEAKKLGRVGCLVQGTIYPDVIESGSGDASAIKSHHNVGGLPSVIEFDEIIEPLRDLFKDEVRAVGRALGIPEALLMRQPFPGPGLAIRCIGEVTKEKLEALREADAIFRDEMHRSGFDRSAGQFFAVLTDTRSVGVMGDRRTYGKTVVLRSVTTDDFMTADWSRIPYEVLERASSRITNEIPDVTRVTYDITSKPPATVEWE